MVESIITVGLEVVKCLAPPSERQFSYLRNNTSNIENLREGIQKLKDDRDSIQHAVDAAERNGEVIENNVLLWLRSVNNPIVEAEQFVGDEAAANNRCFKGLCPNLKARLRRSKEAVRRLEVVSNLRIDGRFDRISYRSGPEDIRLLPSKDYEAFESRKSILKDILDALKNPDVNVVGICGLGGIGKTTLAKVVAKQVESDKLFDQVVFAEVSQTPDIRKIQGEIAEKLGVQFGEATESGRANILWDRLKKEKKTLLILDNIWEKLDLQVVGIPHSDHHKGCKILLTARSRETLSTNMDCEKNFQIGVLDDEEAWRLFKKMAGDYIESSQYKSIAADVVKECGGLPVSIVTVARALRNKDLFEWKDALQKLRSPSSTNYKDIQPAAYSAIELSYDKLEGEELKKVFLLIGFTYIRDFDDLLKYSMGLGLFQGIRRIEEVRVRVRTLVQKLKASCMLLDDKKTELSMHDVVRDVAISIATTKYNVRTMINGELLNKWELSDESIVKFYTSMVLRDVKIDVLPEILECPQLKLLHLVPSDRSSSEKISDKFFTRMVQLRVLDLTKWNLPSLPSSLGLLRNLRTLCLDSCNLQDIVVVGVLERLEILSLINSEIRRLPKEVCQLTRLMSLDLRGCWRLQVIPPNVLSKLSHLEELYIALFSNWEVEVEELKNASPVELKHLPNLTNLQITIQDINILPKGLSFKKLDRYNIRIGRVRWFMPISGFSRTEWSSRIFKLMRNANVSFKDGMILQLKGVEELTLCGLQEEDMNYFAFELLQGGFPLLRLLMLIDCAAPNINTRELKHRGSIFPDLQYLRVETKQVSWICQSTEDFFCKLKCLDVDLDESSKENFSSLDDLFPIFHFNTVKFLHICGESEWGKLEPKVLSEAEGVIRKVNEFGDIKHILKPNGFLHNLEKLEIRRLKCENLTNLLPSSTSFHNLTTLELWSCTGFKKLLPSSTAKSLVQLRRMIIHGSDTTTEIVAADEGEGEAKDEIIFRELKALVLSSLSGLTSFCSGNCTFIFPSLKKLVVVDCPNMKIFCEGELSTPMLQKVRLSSVTKDHRRTWKGDLNTTIEQLYLKTTKGKEEEAIEEIDEKIDGEDSSDDDDLGYGWNSGLQL